MIFLVSNGNQKELDAVILVINYESGTHYSEI
jgi:hypothetical protein